MDEIKYTEKFFYTEENFYPLDEYRTTLIIREYE